MLPIGVVAASVPQLAALVGLWEAPEVGDPVAFDAPVVSKRGDMGPATASCRVDGGFV